MTGRRLFAAPRGNILGGDAETYEEFEKSPSYLAAPPPRDGELTIDPAHIGAGRTLVLEFTERNPAEPEAEGMISWRYAGWVMEGEVKPCDPADDPRWQRPVG